AEHAAAIDERLHKARLQRDRPVVVLPRRLEPLEASQRIAPVVVSGRGIWPLCQRPVEALNRVGGAIESDQGIAAAVERLGIEWRQDESPLVGGERVGKVAKL